MAGIVDHGNVGTLGILDETGKALGQLPAVGIGDEIDLEAEIRQQPFDRLGIVGGIGERRQVLVLRLADDQRDAVQRLFRRAGGQGKDEAEQRQRDGGADVAAARCVPMPTAMPFALKSPVGRQSRRR